MGGVLTLPTRSEPNDFCTLCCEVDTILRSRISGPYSQHDTTGTQDLYLGRKSELLERSPRCQSCCAFVSCAEEDRASLSNSQKQLLFAGDYDFSAHLMGQNPILGIVFGSLPSKSTDASERRRCIEQLGVLWLFSTDQDVPEGSTTWLAGRPRLFDPRQCDPSIIREWLNHCNCFHGHRCLKPQAWRPKYEIAHNFIDTKLECIVTPTTEVPFVALSYVWGPVETLQALESNIDNLKLPGSLSSSSSQVVPQTIRDAIRLCALTGYRYLWVDRVCIIQDSHTMKHQHLQAMAWIYAAAEFTIVAADGSDVNHGLSGLSQSVEERQKHLIPFPSKSLIKGSLWTLGGSLLSDTVWSSRGWTFQEHVFSRRLLYINKFANWVCASSQWTEALSLSPETSQLMTSKREDYHSADGKLFVIDWPSLRYYASMVEQYNVRNLTYDWDVANAFGGLLSQMCMGFSAGFYGGIPEFYFTICLLWQPRKGLRPRFNQSDTRFLPTWSWLGWSGALDLQMWTCNTDMELPPTPYEVTITPVTEWFKAPDRKGDSHVNYTYFQVRKFFLESGATIPYGWQKHDGDFGSGYHPYYTYHEHNHIGSSKKFRYPIPPLQRYRNVSPVDLSARYLYSSVQKAFFVFGAPEEDTCQRPGPYRDGSYDIIELPLYMTTSAWAGSIRINIHESEPLPIGQVCEVIRIAKGSLPLKGKDVAKVRQQGQVRPSTVNLGGFQQSCPFKNCVDREELREENAFEFYFVLWIRWEGDTVRRQALGVIWEPIWEQAAPENVDIKLG
ncbi:heterokaryon incompatibility protein-domain-containing protein [Xylaria sp. FL1042]|nr:heterokaryon incompatibility protein-domain-containing protein [Xylaria sp. FL1042]